MMTEQHPYDIPQCPDWLWNLLIDRLMHLIAMGLAGHPPADTVALTAKMWAECFLARSLAWEQEQDEKRIMQGFFRLQPDLDRWPTPKQLLEQIPPRLTPQRLMLEERPRKNRDELTPEELAVHNEAARQAWENIRKLKHQKDMRRAMAQPVIVKGVAV